MKKKIIVCVFLLLITITAILSIVGAITSYDYEMNNYPDDKFVGFGAVLSLMVGGFLVFYELDLFYTVYYFFIKPKTLSKSILNICSNLSLLLIFFTDSIASFLCKHISKIFSEEIIALFALLGLYLVLRTSCYVVSVVQRQ